MSSSDGSSGGGYDSGGGGSSYSGGRSDPGTNDDLCGCFEDDVCCGMNCALLCSMIPEVDSPLLFWISVCLHFMFIPGTGTLLLAVVAIMKREENEERGKHGIYWAIIGVLQLFTSGICGFGLCWSLTWGCCIVIKRWSRGQPCCCGGEA